ncbi:hypothetical protein [Methylophilus sp.]|uniref:hypothetical protein n=1 Tax=Methylophilus sp. TaxID=29541 RepID=UPI000D4E0CF7|nr:hypothetical protein [Methylophilus sp.]PPD11482.1 MAG: hypothetical protein CTY26_08875 [Methylophilus sp.]
MLAITKQVSAFVTWLSDAPQGAIAILTATLAAAVALLVAFLTQWTLSRRTRTELLTKKLEELYLALNEVSAHNLKRVEEALPLITATPFTKHVISGSSVQRQGLDLHKKIVMLVRLYFPRLAAAHQEVFRCNSRVNLLIYEAENGPPLSEEQLLSLSGFYRDAVVAMEEEIIQNRKVLVKDYLFPVRYRRVLIEETQTPGSKRDA